MRVRTVSVGVVCGLICLLALRFQYFKIEPYRFVPGWPGAELASRMPAWSSTVVLLFCTITIFAGGWIVARWNWAENWRRSLQAGAGMGFLAGCLIFDYIVTSWSGIRGHATVLANYYNAVPDELGSEIILGAIVDTGKLLYTNSILVIFGCVALGALGGISSALVDPQDTWGSDPRNPQGWLFRVPMYLLALFGLINLLISNTVLKELHEALGTTPGASVPADTIQLDSSSPQLFMAFSNLSVWLFAFVPLGITWGWILRMWRKNNRVQALSVIWIAVTTIGFLLLFIFLSPGVFSQPQDLLFLVLACCIGSYAGYATQERTEGFMYRFSDWVGYAVGYGILGGTQLIAGLIALATTLFTVTLNNIPHLVLNAPIDIEYSPVSQVVMLYSYQLVASTITIVLLIALGTVIAIFVSFLRTVLGIKDIAIPRDQESELLRHQS